jgi:hypothetical protein
MSSRRSALVLVLAAIAGAGACQGRPLELATFPDALASSYCEWQHRCGAVDDVEACHADVMAKQGEVLDYAQRDVKAGILRFDAAGAQACVDAYQTAGCSTNEHADRLAPRGEALACTGALIGPGVDNAPCLIGPECASGFCAVSCSQGCCRGTCGGLPPKTGKIGDACGYDTCDDSGFCDTDQRCKAKLGEGEACEYVYQCRDGLLCHGDEPHRTCQPPVAPGAACQPGESNGDYRWPDCGAIGESCVNGTCVAKAGRGAPCAGAACRADLVCGGPASAPTCGPWPTLGEPCTQQGCAGDLICVGVTSVAPGRCTALLPDGAACSLDGLSCESQTCVKGTCAPYGPCP